MCDCVNVQFGTFGHPDQNRMAVLTCYNKLQEIDNCLLPELHFLWSNRIMTEASCCGHNKINGSIIVDDPNSAHRMRTWGYIEYQNNNIPGFDPTKHIGFWFFPKSIPITNKYG